MTNGILLGLVALGSRAVFCLGVLLFWVVALLSVAVLCGIGTIRGLLGYSPRYPHRLCPRILQTIEDDLIHMHLCEGADPVPWRRVWVQATVRGVAAPLPVHSLVVGRDESKPALLLIHGTGGSAASWLPAVRHLARDFHIHLVDLPGFGRTVGVPEGVVPTTTCDGVLVFYIAFLEAFFIAAGLDGGTTLLAHSYGAFLATKFAAQHPNMVSRLLLVHLAGAFCTQAACGAWLSSVFCAEFPQCVNRVLGCAGIHAQYSLYDLAGSDCGPYLTAQLHSNSWAHKTVATFIQQDALTSHWRVPLLPDLLALPMPVAFFYGEDDCLIPAHNGEAIVAVADAAVPCYLFPGAGHSPFEEPTFALAVTDAFHTAVPFGPLANKLARSLEAEGMAKFRTCYHTGEARRVILAQYAHIRALADPGIKVGRIVRWTGV